MDTVRAAERNGLPVPKEFDDPEVRNTMENAICHEWFGGYCEHNA
jgi:acid phosphatase